MHTLALMYINFSLDDQKDFGKDLADLSSDDFTMGKLRRLSKEKDNNNTIIHHIKIILFTICR